MIGLILDHNGVICDGRSFYEERSRRIAKIFKIKWTEELMQLWKKVYIDASLGKISLNDYYLKLSKAFNLKINGNEDDLFIAKEILIEGVSETLKKIREKNIKIALLSNYVQRWVDKFLEDKKIREYFDAVVVSSSIGIRKPHQEAYKIAAKTINIPMEKCIYVGDSIVDLEVCRKLGIRPVFILGEETSPKDFEMVKNIKELPNLLK